MIEYNGNLYINFGLAHSSQIHSYSALGALMEIFEYDVDAFDILNHFFYLMGKGQFYLVDLKSNKQTQSWNLPSEQKQYRGRLALKADQEDKVYFSHESVSSLYLYTTNGKAIWKLETCAIVTDLTLDAHNLYVCDYLDKQVKVIDKQNRKCIREWNVGTERSFGCRPNSILLRDDVLYVALEYKIQLFTKQGECLQTLLAKGCNQDYSIKGLCIVSGVLFIAKHFTDCIERWER